MKKLTKNITGHLEPFWSHDELLVIDSDMNEINVNSALIIDSKTGQDLAVCKHLSSASEIPTNDSRDYINKKVNNSLLK